MNYHNAVKAQNKLKKMYAGQLSEISVPWEQSPWSRSYKAILTDGTALYLKGAPRIRMEADIAKRLHAITPHWVPEVIADDLLPESGWRWFIMADAGPCSHDEITPEHAEKAAYRLGQLQRAVQAEPWFQRALPQCEAHRLPEAVRAVGKWALTYASGMDADIIRSVMSIDPERYAVHAERLGILPSTCVHKDFWSGNIACDQEQEDVMFIDWADAVWGVGGCSIVNLIGAEEDRLEDRSAAIWQAYFKGWDIALDDHYIKSCEVANTVSDLIVEKEIAALQKQRYGPGMIPSFQRLHELLTTAGGR